MSSGRRAPDATTLSVTPASASRSTTSGTDPASTSTSTAAPSANPGCAADTA